MGRFRDVELDDLELTGDRLVLRRWQEGDAARVHEIMQDRSMWQFLALPSPYTRDVAREFVTNLGHEGRGIGIGVGSAVVERSTGRIVGAAAIRFPGQPDVGYWIAPDSRGHGYAAEACRILVEFAFRLRLPRVQLACDVRNLASAHTALAAGFRFEGVFRDAGVTTGGAGPADLACFARLPEDPDEPILPVFTPLPRGGLDDGVIALRELAPGDAESFAGADDDLTRRTGFGGPTHTMRDYERVTARAGLDWLVGSRAMAAIVDIATGVFAGSVTVRQAGPPDIGGIGYVVHPDFRGRGYTARALRLLVPWAFGTAGFARLELGAKTSNVASQRAAIAAGFEPDGIRRGRLRNVAGGYENEARFCLLNPTVSPSRTAPGLTRNHP